MFVKLFAFLQKPNSLATLKIYSVVLAEIFGDRRSASDTAPRETPARAAISSIVTVCAICCLPSHRLHKDTDHDDAHFVVEKHGIEQGRFLSICRYSELNFDIMRELHAEINAKAQAT